MTIAAVVSTQAADITVAKAALDEARAAFRHSPNGDNHLRVLKATNAMNARLEEWAHSNG